MFSAPPSCTLESLAISQVQMHLNPQGGTVMQPRNTAKIEVFQLVLNARTHRTLRPKWPQPAPTQRIRDLKVLLVERDLPEMDSHTFMLEFSRDVSDTRFRFSFFSRRDRAQVPLASRHVPPAYETCITAFAAIGR